MFAASSAFMTPIGYQTNLMVYGPGGYRFTDYVRVGAPLQLLLTVVTTLGIAFFGGSDELRTKRGSVPDLPDPSTCSDTS